MSITKLLGRGAAVALATAMALTLSPVPQEAQAAGESITLQSAHPIAPVGQTITARARIKPALAGQTGFTQVLVNGKWSTSATIRTNSRGEFTLPLTYGRNTVGRYAFRMGATVRGVKVYTKSFWVVRQSKLSLISAPGIVTVGTPGNVKVRTTPARGTGFIQVWYSNRWVTVQRAAPTSAGVLNLRYNYGVSNGGWYLFRAGVSLNGVNTYTKAWWVGRALTYRQMPASFAGGTRDGCYGSRCNWIGTPNGGASIAFWYSGNMNGYRDSIVAANVHSARISALNPYSFTNKRTYAGGITCGTWLTYNKMCAIAKGTGFRVVQARHNAYGGLSDSWLVYFVKDLASRT